MMRPALAALTLFALLGADRSAQAAPPTQDWEIAKGALIELLKLPIDPFILLSRKLVERHSEAYAAKAQNPPERPSGCELWSDQSSRPEGERCSCEQVCTESYEILARMEPRMQPRTENLLHYLNEAEDYQDIRPRTQGYCWAHTTVLRNFNYLAFFDLENRAAQAVPDRPTEPSRWRRFYRSKIRAVLNREATVIPGFADLWSFTSDPEILEEMKEQTVRTWRRTAMRPESLAIFGRSLKKSDMTFEEARKLIARIREGLSLHQTPKIWMAHREDATSIHVIPVYEIRETEEGARLCFVDNHDYAEAHADCGRSLLVRKDGSLYYKEWDFFHDRPRNVKAFGLTPEDKYENVRYVQQLARACRQQTQCRAR